jgi:hypothetical protein
LWFGSIFDQLFEKNRRRHLVFSLLSRKLLKTKQRLNFFLNPTKPENRGALKNMADQVVVVEATKPYTVKIEGGMTKYYHPKLKEFKTVANFVWEFVAHAIKDGIELYVMQMTQFDRIGDPLVWHLGLNQSDTGNNKELCKKMAKQGASLSEENFKEGQIHEHVRQQMIEYRSLPDQCDASVNGRRKNEVILDGVFFEKFR